MAVLFILMGWTTVGAVREPPLQDPSHQLPLSVTGTGRHPLPTLARLSFWVPPARMSEFEAAYREKVAPILKRHGLMESSERGRATPDSIFSRLFEMKTPSEVEGKQKALQGDSTWKEVLRGLGSVFKTSQTDSLIRYSFRLYAAPAGLGKKAPAGSGKVVSAGRRTGYWHTYGETDGFTGVGWVSIFQDREGYLWFGTEGGVSRYDGQTFTALNGLANNWVRSIFQDREGYLWFGTQGGVSRYDGQTFTTFTAKNGLVNNEVWSIFQDQEDNLWFGTNGGVTRYAPLTSSGSAGKTFTTLTTKDGLADNSVWSIIQDREGHLWFGTGRGVSRYDGQKFITFTSKDGLANDNVTSIIQDQEGNLWFGTNSGVSRYDGQKITTFTTKELAQHPVISIFQDREKNIWFCTFRFGVVRYDGQTFTTFTTKDGLAHNWMRSIFQDREGNLWFGTQVGEVSRYDGQTFTTFALEDSIASNNVSSMFQDREGNLWFGTLMGGVNRYNGKTFTTFTTEDGPDWVRSIVQDLEGNLWFGTQMGGVSRYDGKTFTTFTTQDGLGSNEVWSIFHDRKGHLWFGTRGGGVSRYDGKTFTTFTTQDGLASNRVQSILQDREGYFWFGTWGGVSRYDEQKFITFTVKEGLASNGVEAILQDRNGNLWFGTWGGVSRYDGKTFTDFTTRDGLANNNVSSIFQDKKGHLWFGTYRGGLSRYDGQVFQVLTRQDGLASNQVLSIIQDREEYLWFGTLNGVTRYRSPAPSPPPVFIDAVIADRRYEKPSNLAISATVKLAAFEFRAISFKTRPEAMVYRYRLKGYDKDWQNTHARRVEYQDLPIGTYTFEVVAVDRDLVYSEKPATVRLTVHPPYGTLALAGGLILALGVAGVASGYAIKRRRELFAEMQKELQTAHDMQMGLMPRESPRIEGLDLAGRCLPANHVGGDYYQYFSQDGKLTLVLADVTGHAMEAAIPVVMFSGILKSHIELGGTLQERFGRLNRSLHGTLTGRTLVCLAMGEFDLVTRTLSLSDSGCPYPYHYRASTGDVVELQVDAYPLGVRPDTDYPVIETHLQIGDRVVFCSDGIMEAVNAAGEQFGYERTTEVIRRACQEGLSAEATIDRILREVNAFRGNTPQADDMTCVVVRVEDTNRWRHVAQNQAI